MFASAYPFLFLLKINFLKFNYFMIPFKFAHSKCNACLNDAYFILKNNFSVGGAPIFCRKKFKKFKDSQYYLHWCDLLPLVACQAYYYIDRSSNLNFLNV